MANAPDRRDLLPRTRTDPVDNPTEISTTPGEVAEYINNTIDRVSSASINEIEGLVAELCNIRDLMRSETERIQREVLDYVSETQAATTSTKIIADTLVQWKSNGSNQ